MKDITDKLDIKERNFLPWLNEAGVRNRLFWYILAIAVISGVVGVLVTGPVRAVTVLVLVLCFLSAVLILARSPVLERVRVDNLDQVHTPRERIAQFLYTTLAIVYNASILVVLLAIMIRFGAVDIRVDVAMQEWAPLAFAAYHLLMALAAKMRIEQLGVHEPTWYIRTMNITLIISGGVAVVLASWMIFQPTVHLGSFAISEVDLLVTILFVWVAAATQLFFMARLPTLYDIVMRFFEKDDGEAQVSETPPIIYAALAAVGATVIIGFIVSKLGLFSSIGGALSSEKGAYILILLPVALAGFGAYTGLRMYKEGRRGLYKKRIPTKLRNDILVFGISSLAGIAFSIMAFMVITERWTDIFGMAIGKNTAKDLIMLTLLVTLGPIGFYMNNQAKRVDHIEMRLADFLNDLAETRRAGLTLTASLHTAALSDYGALTKEVRKMSNQVAWGVPFTEALIQFSDRVESSLVQRSTSLIIEASKSGGSVAEILKAAANDAREIKGLEQERKVTLSTYLVIIYVTFFVFMVVIGSLDTQFIPQVADAQDKIRLADLPDNGGGFSDILSEEPLDQDALRFTYYNAAIVQAIGNGIIAGLLVDQRITSGFRHVAIMAFMAWILFRWLLEIGG